MAFNLYQAMGKVYNTSGEAWPMTGDPNKATSARLCFRILKTVNGPSITYKYTCSTWTLRKVAETVAGNTVTTPKWQHQQAVTKTYRAYVAGRYVSEKVRGKTTKVWVAGHYEYRSRTVTTWVSDDPFVVNFKWAN